jgi:hypothetical protein
MFLGQPDAIKMDPVAAAYSNAILRAAASAGWKQGTPLLNLTGYGAGGVNLILNAPFVAMPGLVGIGRIYHGGFPGGQNAFAFVAAHMDPKLADEAWVFTSKNGRLRLDPRILHRRGCNFPGGYRLLREIPSYRGDHFTEGAPEIHQLWRPTSPAEGC